MDLPARTIEHLRRGPSKGRCRGLLLAILGTVVLLGSWRAWPRIAYQIQVHQAERAIDEGRLDEAEERLDLLIQEKPMKTWPRFLRARVARLRGEVTRAEEILQRAVELGLPVQQARVEHDLLQMAGSLTSGP